MRVCLSLTEYQRALIKRMLTGTGLSLAALASAAVERELRRAEPRWQVPRPSARAPSDDLSEVRFDRVLPAASGAALTIGAGQRLRIEQVVDGQCVDLCAFEVGGLRRSFSAARTRAAHGIHPTVGASLWSTPPEVPLLRIIADTAPTHDLCFPACSTFEYEQHAGLGGHLGCAELHAAVGTPDASRAGGGDVLNLWLPSAIDPDGRLRSWPVACRRGDFIELQAQVAVLVSLSTCPDDLFGSSQYEPGPVRVLVTGTGDHGTTPAPIAWPERPPASAIACHTREITLPARTGSQCRALAAGGWLGTTAADVARAAIFRYYEAERSAGLRFDAGSQCGLRR